MSDSQIKNGHTPALPAVASTVTGYLAPQPPQPSTLEQQADAHVARLVEERGMPGRAPKVKGRKFQNLLTAIVALIATGAAATGMWAYFRDVLHVTNPYLRIGFFAVFEMSLLVSALRARRARIDDPEDGKAGIDGYAVWVISTTSGVLSALDEHSWPARFGRLALPLLAAFMFERAISAERRDHQRARGKAARARINWRISPNRIMVWVGLADATNRDVADVDRARTVARLATLAYRAHTAGWGNKNRARRKYSRSLARANERLSLAKDQSLVGEVRAGVALLYQGLDATHPAAVDTASPWTKAANREQSALERQQRPAPAAARRQVTADVEPARTPHNPGHDRVREVAPTKTARSADENWALIQQHLAVNPEASQTELADVLDLSRTRIGQLFAKFQPKTREDAL